MRFNQNEYAGFYHRQMTEAGYPGKLLPFIMNEIELSSSVLDIGSGTGFFTIPLAETGHKVTAVEPSTEMINIMIANSPLEILSSVQICNTTWEEWAGGVHDAAISVHSLYPMPDIKKAIMKINESAINKILIVRNSSGMKTLSGIIRKKLGIFSNRDLNDEIVSILNEMGAEWKVENIYEERKHSIKSLGEESESILYQLKLDRSFLDKIDSIIKDEINYSAEIPFFNTIYSDNAYIFK